MECASFLAFLFIVEVLSVYINNCITYSHSEADILSLKTSACVLLLSVDGEWKSY